MPYMEEGKLQIVFDIKKCMFSLLRWRICRFFFFNVLLNFDIQLSMHSK